jgi:hypothetical protein
MKRAHRRWQRVLWWLVGPVLAWVLFQALTERSSVPANPALPTALLTASTPRSP